MSVHFLIEARLKLVGGWKRAGRLEGVRNVLKVSELNNRRAIVENMGRWACGECGKRMGKVQRYSNGVYH